MIMIKAQGFSILFLLILVSCSSGEKISKDKNHITVLDEGLYLNDSKEPGVLELVIPEVEEYTQIKKEAEEQAQIKISDIQSSDQGLREVEVIEESVASIGEQDPDEVLRAPANDSENYIAENEKQFLNYKIQKNDSLMLISFKLYNTFDRWRDLAEWNNISFENNYLIEKGQYLKFKVRDENGQTWVPQGSPYLVRVGDYLGLVSQKVYQGNARFWYDIWKNNDVLLKDPNKLLVGFTIYYESFETVLENERQRFEEYQQKYGNRNIRKRDLAGALDPDIKM